MQAFFYERAYPPANEILCNRVELRADWGWVSLVKQLERWLKEQKRPEYVHVLNVKETFDLNYRSWLCSTQVDSSSGVNLRLIVNR